MAGCGPVNEVGVEWRSKREIPRILAPVFKLVILVGQLAAQSHCREHR
jgi:hypothetical protein